jgi:hypothetical protein
MQNAADTGFFTIRQIDESRVIRTQQSAIARTGQSALGQKDDAAMVPTAGWRRGATRLIIGACSSL